MAYSHRRVGETLEIQDALKVLKHVFPNEEVSLLGKNPIHKIGGGKCRDCYRLKTEKGDLVVTFFTFNWQSADPAALHDLQKQLFQHNISVPQMIGEPGILGTTPFEVTRYIPQTPSTRPSTQQLRHLAFELGRLHKIGDDIELPPNFNTGRDLVQAAKLGHRILTSANAAPSFSYVSNTSLRTLFEHAVSSVKTALKKHALPEGFVHGDMNLSNVLFQDEKPILLDWERARKDCYLMEVTKAIMEFIILPNLVTGRSVPRSDINTFIVNYDRVRPLTPEEKKIFPEALKYQAVRCAGKEPIILGRYPRLPQGVSLLTEVSVLSREINIDKILKDRDNSIQTP
ncbi:MAG: phosphotransferase [Rickettsiales bacterium]